MPGARCTRSLMQNKKAHEVVTVGHRFHPAFPHAMVLTVSSALSPVIGFVVTVISRIESLSAPGWADTPPAKT